MNRIIQLILFLFLIILIAVFYDEYFNVDDKTKIEKTPSINKPESPKGNNLIKNLKYEISIREDNFYIINSELSEITNKNGSELILMNKVTAVLTDENSTSLFVSSDNANYNNANYYTNFKNNVEIKYLNNIIFAENVILDFKKNFISINDNIRYNGPLGNLEADTIKINLITKKIDVFMNSASENIVITPNK